jgi:predicted transcriptional regulator/transcriptional regulator with XRE-family HTH domain
MASTITPGKKTFIGPRLRQLRKERGETQAAMASALGISATYVNLLENNQRSLSLQVLMRFSDAYGVDWRELVEEDGANLLADLRNVVQDPIFGDDKPDLHELRSALDHCPKLARNMLRLHKTYRTLSERVLSNSTAEGDSSTVFGVTPESMVHDVFRKNRNHFPTLEAAAEDFRKGEDIATDEVYSYLKARLARKFGIAVIPTAVNDLPDTLRLYDEENRQILISDALDYPNRVFQLTHVLGLMEYGDTIDAVIERAEINEPRGQARCRVELANYFAAAMLMPYEDFLSAAHKNLYDFDHLAALFGVSFEQACHRATTLQRDGAQGVPFFFLRIDKAGNVTKRFNATSFHLAEHGGACPRWNIHLCFRTPGHTLSQFVEMPDGSKYFTINRTVDRPSTGHLSQDNRLAITLGCSIEHASKLVYASLYQLTDPNLTTPIGINCRLCPRQHCAQRAHQPIHLDLPIDENRRGSTRFES